MKAPRLTLGELLSGKSQYAIPAFQRFYRWDHPEWEKLWASLRDYFRPDKTSRHFMGFLVLAPETPVPGQNTVYHLIDGQQRLTTLSLLLCALRNAAASSGFTELAQEIDETHLVHRFKKGTDRYRLYPKQRDREQYFAVVNRQGDPRGRIGAALLYFAARLCEVPDAGTEGGFRRLLALVTDSLEFVHATLESGESQYEIFKGLNSTGVRLGPADLIRNFMFMHVPVADQDEFDEQFWSPLEDRFTNADGVVDGAELSAFFRDYLIKDGQYVGKTGTFDAFEERFLDTTFSPWSVARDLQRAAGWHEAITGDESDIDPEVQSALRLLRVLDSSTTYPLLLQLYQRREEGGLTSAELAAAIGWLSGFILRRLACGEGSRSYGEWFAEACRKLNDAPSEDLRKYLEERGYPDTQRFVEAFVGFNLYASRYRKTILEALERARPHKEPADLSLTSVEHVLPQTLTDAWRSDLGPDAATTHAVWLDTPGNLTLSAYNPDVQNKTFSSKKLEYANSHVQLTKELADREKWDALEIEARGRTLAAVAARLWPGPAVPVPPKPPPAVGVERDYWAAFRQHPPSSGSTLGSVRATGLTWSSFAIGRSGFSLVAYLWVQRRQIAATIYLSAPHAKKHFELLDEERTAIQAQITEPLIWVNPPNYKQCSIEIHRDVDPFNRELWPEYHEWTRDHLEKLRGIFKPRIQLLAGGKRVTPIPQLKIEYWTKFGEFLGSRRDALRAPSSHPHYWAGWGTWRTGFQFVAYVGMRDKWLGVSLDLTGPLAKANLSALRRDQAGIERALGPGLIWDDKPGRKAAEILLKKPAADPTDRADWPNQHAWLLEKLQAFEAVFRPRVQALIIGEEVSSPGEA